MSKKKDVSLLGMLLALALAITNFGCGGGAAAPPVVATQLAVSVFRGERSDGHERERYRSRVGCFWRVGCQLCGDGALHEQRRTSDVAGGFEAGRRNRKLLRDAEDDWLANRHRDGYGHSILAGNHECDQCSQ
jgi:hypothetical protein